MSENHHAINYMSSLIRKYDYKNKSGNLSMYNAYALNKTLSMFEWSDLPETIPVRQLELLLQTVGYAFITEVKGNLYAFYGGLGGVQDIYGYPTEITISNVALNLNRTYKLTDGVLIHNDDLDLGLIHLFNRYNTMLVENDINMVMSGYNSRIIKLISASNDRTKESADSYLEKIVNGDLAVIGESSLFEGLKVHGNNEGSSNSITNLIEFQQYIKASLYNELGLSDNFNMKRERLTEGETEANEDSNFTLVYNMFKNRLSAVNHINDKYGTSINVDFGSVWAKGKKEVIDDNIESDCDINPDDFKNLELEIDRNGGLDLAPEPEPEPEPESNTDSETEISDTLIDKVESILDNDIEINSLEVK